MHFERARQQHARMIWDAAAIEKMTARGAPPGVLIGHDNGETGDADGRIFPVHVKR